MAGARRDTFADVAMLEMRPTKPEGLMLSTWRHFTFGQVHLWVSRKRLKFGVETFKKCEARGKSEVELPKNNRI